MKATDAQVEQVLTRVDAAYLRACEVHEREVLYGTLAREPYTLYTPDDEEGL